MGKGDMQKDPFLMNDADYRMVNRWLHEQVDYQVLGARMKTVRRKMGLTQAAMAEKMRMGIKYYASLETGATKINLVRLIQFIAITQTSADYLLVGCHPEYPSSEAICANVSEERQRLNKILDQCSDEFIRTIYIITTSLLEKK